MAPLITSKEYLHVNVLGETTIIGSVYVYGERSIDYLPQYLTATPDVTRHVQVGTSLDM